MTKARRAAAGLFLLGTVAWNGLGIVAGSLAQARPVTEATARSEPGIAAGGDPPAVASVAWDSVGSFVPFPPDSVLPPRLADFEERYLHLLVEFHPVRAGALGLHYGDGRLGPTGFAGQARERLALRAFQAELASAADSLADPDDRFDAALLLYAVRRDLFEMDSLRVWQRDPGKALRVVEQGIRELLAGDPAPSRLWALAQRQRAVPFFLKESLDLLGRPPAPLVEQAIGRADALAVLLRDTVPSATRTVTDTVLVNALNEGRDRALQAVWDYRSALLADFLPGAPEDMALGPRLLAADLDAGAPVTESLDSLRVEAERELNRLDALFRKAAARIDSTVSPREVMLRVSEDHPARDEILETAFRAVAEARLFVVQGGFVPFHALPLPEVLPAPPAFRWANAALSVPGPFETGPARAVLYVTLPDSTSSAEERAQHLRFLNRSQLRNIAVHEVYPGHYLQRLSLARRSRPARRAVRNRGFEEGWAHYAESLMLEQGYRSDDPAFRLVTLQAALRRAGRFRVALGLHAEGWTVDRAVSFLEERCYLEPWTAQREAQRGEFDPLYLVYCLGRLRIERLRAELEAREGSGFSLERFHERLLALGSPPLPLARAVLLGRDPLAALPAGSR